MHCTKLEQSASLAAEIVFSADCSGQVTGPRPVGRGPVTLRTKEALASKKAKGHTLGKPKGTIQKVNLMRTAIELWNY
ncbi:hypothetical protein AB7W30_22610 [Providencia manganoxydans]|uniref:hypothetical protein n=1 Tax=Providencia manganoxydans TaxID=2923283 RepID=UPI0032DB14BE